MIQRQLTLLLFASVFSSNVLLAQTETKPRPAPNPRVLDQEQWKQVDDSIKRGLEWLSKQQNADGSFETLELGQPAVTALCVMAFLAQGESPVNGRYQKQLTKAIDYIASQQQPNGLVAILAPNAVPIPRVFRNSSTGQHAAYNHGISSIALTESYGQCDPEQAKRLMPVIEKAIAATLEMQRWPKRKKDQVGGWRYVHNREPGLDSDLSITGWQLMFLRSARNAGFELPEESIDSAVEYVESCFLKRGDRQVHAYLGSNVHKCTRAMAGAGVLALAHAGKHNSKEAALSGEWILKHDFSNYNNDRAPYAATGHKDRYHYGALQCSQAMFQLGGKYWDEFFPILVDALLTNQEANGSWPPERRESDYGSCYSTALSILSMSVPNQMLPIFQR